MLKCLNVKMNTGFTLVEMLVVCLIFSIIIGAMTGVFVSAIRAQRYNLTYQQLLDQTSYAMEYIARAIRMAQIDDGTCTGTVGKNYNKPDDYTIEFRDYKGNCQEFFLDTINKKLKATKTGSDGYNGLDLTSGDFEVDPLKFKFEVSGDGEDTLQPKVTVFMEIKGGGSDLQPSIKIQTTISQRNMYTQ